jgi:hypothetical protein
LNVLCHTTLYNTKLINVVLRYTRLINVVPYLHNKVAWFAELCGVQSVLH